MAAYPSLRAAAQSCPIRRLIAATPDFMLHVHNSGNGAHCEKVQVK
jgi:hypothetical protein